MPGWVYPDSASVGELPRSDKYFHIGNLQGVASKKMWPGPCLLLVAKLAHGLWGYGHCPIYRWQQFDAISTGNRPSLRRQPLSSKCGHHNPQPSTKFVNTDISRGQGADRCYCLRCICIQMPTAYSEENAGRRKRGALVPIVAPGNRPAAAAGPPPIRPVTVKLI